MDDTAPAPGRPRGKRRPGYTFAEGRYYPPAPSGPEVVPDDTWVEYDEDVVPRPAPRRPIWWSYVLTAVVALAVGIVIGQNGLVTDWSQPPAPAAPRDAPSVVETLTRAVPSARSGVVYTAETDPNHLLGRPGAYTSKAEFSDVRAAVTDTPGSVEVFPSAALAESRRDYIRTVAQGLPMVTEYDFVVGSVLVRVPGTLTPQQAVEYQTAVQG